MSWSGSGGFFGPGLKAAAAVTVLAPVSPAPADPRRLARLHYAQGRLDDAMAVQATVLNGPDVQADDVLFKGLILHAAGQIDDAIVLLRDGVAHWPQHASMHENLAVLRLAADDPVAAIDSAQTALSLGAASANLHDCLCEAYAHLGRLDLSIQSGRTALGAKDQRFGKAAPLVRMPHPRPRPFSAEMPEANIIAYSLWGDQPRYLVPLMENAKVLPHLFPGWTMRVYHDRTVPTDYLTELASRGVQLCGMVRAAGQPAHRGLLWRFVPIADPTVHRFLIRDADALLTVKERVAVDAWLMSSRYFHAMRDWYTHTDLILAGMWGGVGGILPAPGVLLQAYTEWRLETNHIDQDLLSETVWPSVRDNILIHDSIFHPCLGSVPFPPFGALAPGHHIGQNGFLHFNKSG